MANDFGILRQGHYANTTCTICGNLAQTKPAFVDGPSRRIVCNDCLQQMKRLEIEVNTGQQVTELEP